MTCRSKLKLSAVALLVMSATNAHAALYQIVEFPASTGANIGDYASSYGVAIQQGDTAAASDSLGCFASGVTCTDYDVGVETRVESINAGKMVDGLSYREEVPFAMDNRFYYISKSSRYKYYCENQLLYATCDAWTAPRKRQWLSSNINVYSFVANSADAATSGSATLLDTDYNTVINSLTSTSTVVGNKVTLSSITDAEDGQFSTITSMPSDLSSAALQGREWKSKDGFTVGSIGYSSKDNGYVTHKTTKAAIWSSAGTTGVYSVIDWDDDISADEDDYLAQGSMRDLYYDSSNSIIYGVGYNTYDNDNNYMEATVFVSESGVTSSSLSSSTTWTLKNIKGTKLENSDDKHIYSNSRLTDVNDNGVAVGETKRRGSYPKNGAAENRLFLVSDVTADSLTADYFADDEFFSGAGGQIGDINNYNEIVGQVDAEDVRENNGKVRRKRGFIYPYNASSSDSDRMALFNNKAWLLDNLTNGATNGSSTISSANNAYRIINATDINDDGVISATAAKCSGGYDTTAINSLCGDGDQDETTVAVKLVPIAGATASDIHERGEDETTVTRSGAGLGWFSLIFLGFVSLRRKFHQI